MKKWTTILIIAAVLLTGISIIKNIISVNGSKTSPVNAYYNVDITNLQVEKNLSDTMAQLAAASEEYKTTSAEGKAVDWSALEPKFNEAINRLQDKKSEIEKIKTEDAKVMEINGYLISSYDNMIKGYLSLVKGLKESNDDAINLANTLLSQSKEDISKWQKMLNEQ